MLLLDGCLDQPVFIPAKLEMHAHTTGTPSLQDGDSIDNYRVVEFISKGAGGEVYRAVSSTLEQEIALKLLSTELSCSASLERAQNEARILAALKHPNVVRIYGMGLFKNRIYFAMNLINGRTIAELLKTGGPLSADRAIPMFIALADALAYLHSNGIIHRDLKPSNIVINDDGQPVLIDFGLAKADQSVLQHVTQQGQLKGTPQYMSPEVCAGEPATKASDIYGFGCILYEALMGKPVFEGEHPIEVMMKHLRTTLPSLPVFCESVLRKCLAKSPADRYSSCEELKADLEQLPSKQGIVAPKAKVLDNGTTRNILIGTSVLFCVIAACFIPVLMKTELMKSLLSQLPWSQELPYEGVLSLAADLDHEEGDRLHEAGEIREVVSNRIEAAETWLAKHDSPADRFKAYNTLTALYAAEHNESAKQAASHAKLNAALTLNKFDDAYPIVLQEAVTESNLHALPQSTIQQVAKVYNWFALKMRNDPNDAHLAAMAATTLARASIRENNPTAAQDWIDKAFSAAKFSDSNLTYVTLITAVPVSREAGSPSDKLQQQACLAVRAVKGALDHGEKIDPFVFRQLANPVTQIRDPQQGTPLTELSAELKACLRKLKQRSQEDIDLYSNENPKDPEAQTSALRKAVLDKITLLNTEAHSLICLTDSSKEALACIKESLSLGEKHLCQKTLAYMESLKYLGWIERLQGHTEAATAAEMRALRICQELGDNQAIALAQMQLACDVEIKDPKRALHLLEDSYQRLKAIVITHTQSKNAWLNKSDDAKMLVVIATQLAREYMNQNLPEKALQVITEETNLWKTADFSQFCRIEQDSLVVLKTMCEQRLRK